MCSNWPGKAKHSENPQKEEPAQKSSKLLQTDKVEYLRKGEKKKL